MERTRLPWMTAVAILLGLFLALEGASTIESQPTFGERVVGVVFVAIPGVLLLVGLWGLRRRGFRSNVASSLIVVGLIASVTKFYLVFPVIAGALLLWFGVIRGGLRREAG